MEEWSEANGAGSGGGGFFRAMRGHAMARSVLQGGAKARDGAAGGKARRATSSSSSSAASSSLASSASSASKSRPSPGSSLPLAVSKVSGEAIVEEEAELSDYYRVMQLTEEMLSGSSASRTSALVTSLVQYIIR